MRFNRIIKILPFLILGTLSIFLIIGKVRFGFGLGDIIYHGLVYVGFIIYGIYLFFKKENPQRIHLIFPIISIIFCGYIIIFYTQFKTI